MVKKTKRVYKKKPRKKMTIKKEKTTRPRCKKMKGGAFLFPSITAASNGFTSGLTGLYNNVKGNTQVYDSNVFNQPINKN